eukprot:m.48120 g.48120  ORF g.48120 m.48120 type:complete len:639 (-) comp10814_c0_seq4:1381-3297(-)
MDAKSHGNEMEMGVDDFLREFSLGNGRGDDDDVNRSTRTDLTYSLSHPTTYTTIVEDGSKTITNEEENKLNESEEWLGSDDDDQESNVFMDAFEQAGMESGMTSMMGDESSTSTIVEDVGNINRRLEEVSMEEDDVLSCSSSLSTSQCSSTKGPSCTQDSTFLMKKKKTHNQGVYNNDFFHNNNNGNSVQPVQKKGRARGKYSKRLNAHALANLDIKSAHHSLMRGRPGLSRSLHYARSKLSQQPQLQSSPSQSTLSSISKDVSNKHKPLPPIQNNQETTNLKEKKNLMRKQLNALRKTLEMTRHDKPKSMQVRKENKEHVKLMALSHNAKWEEETIEKLDREIESVWKYQRPQPGQSLKRFELSKQKKLVLYFLLTLKSIIRKLPMDLQDDMEDIIDKYETVFGVQVKPARRQSVLDSVGNELSRKSSTLDILSSPDIKAHFANRSDVNLQHLISSFRPETQAIVEDFERLEPEEMISSLDSYVNEVSLEIDQFHSEIEREVELIETYTMDIERAMEETALCKSSMLEAQKLYGIPPEAKSGDKISAILKEIVLNQRKQKKIRSIRRLYCVPKQIADWLDHSINIARNDTHLRRKQMDLLTIDLADLKQRAMKLHGYDEYKKSMAISKHQQQQHNNG